MDTPVLAYEVTCDIDSDSLRIKSSSIKYDEDENWYYGTGSSGSNQYSFRGVALHEFGHMTGWAGHYPDNSGECDGSGAHHTMCPKPRSDGDAWKSLEQHDVHTFNATYPGDGGPTAVGD